jgi:hypothetical protein
MFGRTRADQFGDKKINETGLARQVSLSEESCNNAESPEGQTRHVD